MFNQRITFLLGEIARGFAEGTDKLLDDTWLQENHVTADEMFALSSLLATIVLGFLNATDSAQYEVFLVGAIGEDVDRHTIRACVSRHSIQAELRRIGAR